MSCFLFSGLDACVMGDILLYKQEMFDVLSLIPRLAIEYLVLPGGECIGESYDGTIGIELQVPPFSASADLLLWSTDLPKVPPDHFAAITRSVWGDVVHAFPMRFRSILQRINGKSSLRAIFRELAQREPTLSEATFKRHIVALNGAGAIRYDRASTDRDDEQFPGVLSNMERTIQYDAAGGVRD